jgi:hypothetical protein
MDLKFNYLPALLSLKFVGTTKYVTEPAPWSEVKKALCLRRNNRIITSIQKL